MKIFHFFALFVVVQAALATDEKDEFHRSKEEMARLSKRMGRQLREGKDVGTIKEQAKALRRTQAGRKTVDEKRAEKYAAHAEKVRKVADGVKKQREHADPRMKHKMESTKVASHSKAAKEAPAKREKPARREKPASNADAVRRMAKQISKQKLKPSDVEGGAKFTKTLPDAKEVKGVAQAIEETASRTREKPKRVRATRKRIEEMPEDVDAEEGEAGEKSEDVDAEEVEAGEN